MSLATPEKIRKLQRALYVKAKQEPTRRFHCLYDKVWREDILAHAYACCRANGGAPGVDGETFSRASKHMAWSAGSTNYGRRFEQNAKPQPVRRVMIPKASGVGQRPLGIPPIRDRVVQTAALLVLEPIFEPDFDEAAYSDEAHCLRELVRHTGGAVGAVQRELEQLTAAGLAHRDVRGRQVYFQANRDAAIFPELQGLFAKTTGLVGILRDELGPLGTRVTVAFVFGSAVRGETPRRQRHKTCSSLVQPHSAIWSRRCDELRSGSGGISIRPSTLRTSFGPGFVRRITF